jgi:microcin C transport system substrate-binding protein
MGGRGSTRATCGARALSSLLLLVGTVGPDAVANPPDRIPYQHAASYIEPLKYPPDFEHFEYVNPDAPKGGLIRFPVLGTFDSFNPIIDKGRNAEGSQNIRQRNLTHDRLLERAIDERASFYGRLAEKIWISEDFSEFAFKIREGARWHDGTPLTAHDVAWTFQNYKTQGAAGIRTALLEVERIEALNDYEVYFQLKPSDLVNRTLPFFVGRHPIHAKHYWESRDPTKTTVEPPLGSGPYKVGDFILGRYVTYERVDDYWGKDIPVNNGRYNWDRMKFDYFRDEAIMVESLKGDVLDIRHETVSKQWMTQYNFPAVQHGYFNRELVYLDRPWGMWWPVAWNLDRERFQDIRVREALYLMYDYPWANRVLLFGFYKHADSVFFNSEMAQQSGLPTADELELLEPFRDQLPPRVFTEEWRAPASTAYGHNREAVERALELFRQAGWEIIDGVMTNVATGEPFSIDFIFVSPALLRSRMPFLDALRRIGIQINARSLEVSNWEFRMRHGRWDGGGVLYIPTNTPGLELRNWFHSSSADLPLGQNWMKIRNPVVDHLIDKVIGASNAREFYAATRALDRVILWNFYWVPTSAQPGFRLVYWNRFGQPDHDLNLQREAWWDTWWWDEEKATRVESGMAELLGNR